MDLIEVARHAGTHLHDVDRHEAADILVLIDDAALERLGDGDPGRWGGCLLASLAAARKQARQSERNGSHRSGGWQHESGTKTRQFSLYRGRSRARMAGGAFWPLPL